MPGRAGLGGGGGGVGVGMGGRGKAMGDKKLVRFG